MEKCGTPRRLHVRTGKLPKIDLAIAKAKGRNTKQQQACHVLMLLLLALALNPLCHHQAAPRSHIRIPSLVVGKGGMVHQEWSVVPKLASLRTRPWSSTNYCVAQRTYNVSNFNYRNFLRNPHVLYSQVGSNEATSLPTKTNFFFTKCF